MSGEAGPDLLALLVLAPVFALGGVVKGTTGMGMVMVAIPLLSLFFSVPEAVAFCMLPTLVSNVYLLVTGGNIWPVLRRHVLLLGVMVTVLALSSRLLVTLDPRVLGAAIGGVALLYVFLEVVGRVPAFLGGSHPLLAPAVGAVAGLLGGMTSFFSIPVILYLVSQRLQRDHFVTVCTAMYLVGSLVLTTALARYRVLDGEVLALSAWAILPLFAGLHVGRRIRRRIGQRPFRIATLVLVALTGVSMIGRSLFS